MDLWMSNARYSIAHSPVPGSIVHNLANRDGNCAALTGSASLSIQPPAINGLCQVIFNMEA